jgi:DNA polymerase-1
MTPHAEKKLFLIDAYSLIFRAYYAFINNPRVNSKGKNTSAIFGFTNSLNEILKKEQPTHIAVVFDPPGGSFRKEIYPEYKANRSATPEDILFAVPYIKQIIEGFNIPVIEIPNFEADDTIGTLAKKAEKEGFTVYMMTPDKDYGQLVSENIFMYKPGRKGGEVEIVGVKEICEKYGIKSPEQVIDILALWGDTADNVPGVPSVGEQTAAKLIAQFGSVEKLIANISLLKGKQKENMIASKDIMRLAKKLVTIPLDVPVELDADLMKRKPIDKEKLEKVFAELEFRTLATQIFGAHQNITSETNSIQNDNSKNETSDSEGTQTSNNFKTIKDVKHEYYLVQNDEEIKNLISALLKQKEFCFDTETTGLDFHSSKVVGIAFSYEANKAYYVNLPNDDEKTLQIIEKFREVFENPNILKVGQNIKFDIQMLKAYGIDVKGPFFDTMLAHYLLQPEQQHNFNFLARKFLNYSPVEIEELIGAKGKDQKNMRDVNPELIKEYSGEDADITLQLKYILEEELKKVNLYEVAIDIEMPLAPVLADIEFSGVRLDKEFLNEYSVKLLEKLKEYEKQIYQMAGSEFNISSPKQLGEILFDKMKIITNPTKTKTGQYATGEPELQKLQSKHEIIDIILNYRQLQKLQNTYVDSLPKLVSLNTQKLHTSFNQAVTATGRLSSTNPNLQNIPIRTAEGREIRKAFVASEGNVILSADYSQIELRLIAAMSEDENMINDFKQGADIHSATAAKIFSLPISEVTKEMRSQAKSANFGIIYGISAFGLAQNLNISRSDAKNLIDNYFKSYPKVKQYMDSQVAFARDKEYVQTYFGRRRYLADINSRNAVVRGVAERNAINAPIQGTAADIIKLAMIKIYEKIQDQKLKTKMILQVHDELVFDCIPEELEVVKQLVKNEMENAAQLSVPLIVEIGTGNNWLEAH